MAAIESSTPLRSRSVTRPSHESGAKPRWKRSIVASEKPAPGAVRARRGAALVGEHTAENTPRPSGWLRKSLLVRCARAPPADSPARVRCRPRREHANRVDESDVLRLLQKRMASPPVAAAETLEETAIGMHVERRRLLGVKRAEPDEIVAALAQAERTSRSIRQYRYARGFRAELLVDFTLRHRLRQSARGFRGDDVRRRAFSEAHLRPDSSLHRVIHSRGSPSRSAGDAALAAAASVGIGVLGVSVGRAFALHALPRRARDRERARFDELHRSGRRRVRNLGGCGVSAAPRPRRLLLHDIGHGPFSHACESVLEIRHEARTADLIALPGVARGIADLDVDPRDVLV